MSAPPMNASPEPHSAVPPHAAIPVAPAAAPPSALRAAITAAWLRDEATHVRELLLQARQEPLVQAEIDALAADLVRRVRARAQDQGAIEAFMRRGAR